MGSEMCIRDRVRAITLLGASQSLDAENREAISDVASTGMNMANQAIGQVAPQLQQSAPQPAPAPQPAIDVLRDVEMNKLFGVTP